MKTAEAIEAAHEAADPTWLKATEKALDAILAKPGAEFTTGDIWDALTKQGVKMPQVGMPLRAKVCGVTNTPSVDAVLMFTLRHVMVGAAAGRMTVSALRSGRTSSVRATLSQSLRTLASTRMTSCSLKSCERRSAAACGGLPTPHP